MTTIEGVVAKRRPSRPDTWTQALVDKRNVMHAVVLRDIRTRFFDHGLGFLLVPLWPLAHMLCLLTIYHFTGRQAPYGDSLHLFFATGLIPTLLFMYVSRFMSLSLVVNKPMLAFPIVTMLDVIAARAFLEIVGAVMTAALMATILYFVGDNPWPDDLDQAVLAYLATILLAVGVGTLVSVLVMFANFFVTIYALSLILVYILSGTLFVAPALPTEIGEILAWNPVLQCVEWMRTAYFPTYPDKLLDRMYVVQCGLGFLLTGLFLERFLRMKMMEG